VKYAEARPADDDELLTAIKADEHPLVRYCPFEVKLWSIHLPNAAAIDGFLQEPLDARLAAARSRDFSGDTFAGIVRRAIETGIVGDAEIVLMVQEYLGEKGRGGRFPSGYDFWSDYSDWTEFAALWRLVPVVPLQVANELVARLPATNPSGHCIPNEVLEYMKDKGLLEGLLWRSDVDLRKVREAVFLSNRERLGVDSLVDAAVHRCFDLRDTAFQEVLTKNPAGLSALAYAEDLRLVILEAARDYCVSAEGNKFGRLANDFERQYRSRLRRIGRTWRAAEELRQVWLYRLASVWVGKVANESQGTQTDPPDLAETSPYQKLLSRLVVSGDRWATYLAFSQGWRDEWDTHLERYSLADERQSLSSRTYLMIKKRLVSLDRRLRRIEQVVREFSTR
jgi:hypothetical protein